MKCALLLVLLCASCTCLSESEYLLRFKHFTAKYNKTYATADEASKRYEIFKQNVEYIEAHNAKGLSYTLGMNRFGDLSFVEYKRTLLGFKPDPTQKKISEFKAPSNRGLPSSWDWRNRKAVTDIKNQGQCGSCWSFSATGAVEGTWAISTGLLTGLSEQNILDCSWNSPYNNTGCDGGDPRSALQYIIDNRGVDTEYSYPYVDVNGGDQEPCTYNVESLGARISGMAAVIQGNETDLAYAALKAPVSVAIDASHNSFQFYQWGIYYEPMCGNTLDDLDHGVLVVGFGDGYWWVKNSWGEDWGDAGYIQMSRGESNNCGIATYATIALP